MRNLQAKFVSFVKKHKILSVFLTLIFVLCLWWVWTAFAPHPLGDKMEYLGKKDYGNIFGFDYQPYSVYYYGTDMSVGEIEKYFSEAKIQYPSEDKGEYTEIWLQGAHSSETVELYYYATPQKDAPATTTKKHVVEVQDGYYDALKKSL